MTARTADPAAAARRDRIAELVHDERGEEPLWRVVVASPALAHVARHYRNLADEILDLVERDR